MNAENSSNAPASGGKRVEELSCRLAIYQGLVRVSTLINSITDYGKMLEATLDVARDVLDAEAASLFFPRDGGAALELRIATSGTGFEKPNLAIPHGRGVVWWAWEKREAVLIEDAYADPRFYAEADRDTGFRTRSMLCAPLIHSGESIGVLQVLNPRHKASFDAADLEAIQGYSSLIATALEKIRAMETQRREELLHRDLAIAAEMQRGLLARAIPADLSAVRVHAENHPAHEVGGDFYYACEDAARQHTYFAIGDVAGKGIAAAMLMNQIMSVLGILSQNRLQPARALERINATLCRLTVRGMFATITLGRIQHQSGRIELASAGHCQPWLLRPAGPPRELHPGSAPPVGILPATRFLQSRSVLHHGETLLFFTDGLSESRAVGNGEFFGDRIGQRLQAAPPDPYQLCKFLLEEEAAFRAGEPARDDLTVLAVALM